MTVMTVIYIYSHYIHFEVRTKHVSVDIYALNLFIEHSEEHWWEQNVFCSLTTPLAFWQSSAPFALSILVTLGISSWSCRVPDLKFVALFSALYITGANAPLGLVNAANPASLKHWNVRAWSCFPLMIAMFIKLVLCARNFDVSSNPTVSIAYRLAYRYREILVLTYI